MIETSSEILLVEDNPADVELTLRAFARTKLPTPIRVARDGVEALEYLFVSETDSTRHPRMVLLDLKLPRVDGLEVLRRLKADPRTHSIPVVVLTTSNQDRDVSECYRLGANSFIVKPVDYEQFMKAIGTLGVYWTELNLSPG